MSLARTVLKRLALGAVAVVAILSVVFVLFALTDDWVLQSRLGQLRWGGADPSEVRAARDAYFASRGLDRPLPALYLSYLWEMLTLQWGSSFRTGEPVVSMVGGAVVRTATYVLPAVVLALVSGVLTGLYAALRPDGYLADLGRGTAYLLFAIPGFWVGGLVLSLALAGVLGDATLLLQYVLPTLLTASTLLGAYVSYARAYSLSFASTDVVRLLEAKGGGPLVVARHVLRNAAIPLVSMAFTEVLGLLVLTVFVVEVVFGIEGFGLLLFRSIEQRDLPVILGGTLVVVAVGVGGNVLQDVSYSLLDPRVDTGRRD